MEPRPREGTFSNVEKASPAHRLVADLDGVYYLLSEVAQILGVSKTTLRRKLLNKEIKAPSYTAEQGGMRMYLYTKEDIEELRAHVQGKKRSSGKEAN